MDILTFHEFYNMHLCFNDAAHMEKSVIVALHFPLECIACNLWEAEIFLAVPHIMYIHSISRMSTIPWIFWRDLHAFSCHSWWASRFISCTIQRIHGAMATLLFLCYWESNVLPILHCQKCINKASFLSEVIFKVINLKIYHIKSNKISKYIRKFMDVAMNRGVYSS